MALAAVKTFIDAEVLYASDLNAVNTNILNNALSLVSPLTGNLDCDEYALTNVKSLRLDDTAAAPTTDGDFQRNGLTMQFASVIGGTTVVQILRAHLGGFLTVAPAATTGTTEQTLSSISVDSRIYDRTGWLLRYRCSWATAANNNQKVAKFHMDDSVTTPITILDTTANDARFETTIWIWSTGTDTQRIQVMTVGATAGGTGIMSTPAITDYTMDQSVTPVAFIFRGLTPTLLGDLTLLMASLSLEA